MLIGSPHDTPSSFGTIQTLLPPGNEHNLLITPTFIRFRYLTLKMFYRKDLYDTALIPRFRMVWRQTRDIVYSQRRRISLCSGVTRSVTASWSVIWRGPLGARAAFPGISPVRRNPSWPPVIHGRQLSSRWKSARLTRHGPLTNVDLFANNINDTIYPITFKMLNCCCTVMGII